LSSVSTYVSLALSSLGLYGNDSAERTIDKLFSEDVHQWYCTGEEFLRRRVASSIDVHEPGRWHPPSLI